MKKTEVILVVIMILILAFANYAFYTVDKNRVEQVQAEHVGGFTIKEVNIMYHQGTPAAVVYDHMIVILDTNFFRVER